MTRRLRETIVRLLRPRWRLAAIRGEQTMSELAPAVRRASEPDQAVEGAPAGRRARSSTAG